MSTIDPIRAMSLRLRAARGQLIGQTEGPAAERPDDPEAVEYGNMQDQARALQAKRRLDDPATNPHKKAIAANFLANWNRRRAATADAFKLPASVVAENIFREAQGVPSDRFGEVEGMRADLEAKRPGSTRGVTNQTILRRLDEQQETAGQGYFRAGEEPVDSVRPSQVGDFLQQAGPGAIRGLNAAIAQTAGSVSDLVGAPETGEQYREAADFTRSLQPASQTTGGRLGEIVGAVLPSAAGAVSPAALPSALATLGVQTYGGADQRYRETIREQGGTPDAVEGALAGLSSAAAEVIGEAVGISRLGRIGREAADTIVALAKGGRRADAIRLTGRVLESAGVNAGEEAVTQIVNNLSERAIYNEERRLTDDVGTAAVGGAIGGPIVAGAAAAGRLIGRGGRGSVSPASPQVVANAAVGGAVQTPGAQPGGGPLGVDPNLVGSDVPVVGEARRGNAERRGGVGVDGRVLGGGEVSEGGRAAESSGILPAQPRPPGDIPSTPRQDPLLFGDGRATPANQASDQAGTAAPTPVPQSKQARDQGVLTGSQQDQSPGNRRASDRLRAVETGMGNTIGRLSAELQAERRAARTDELTKIGNRKQEAEDIERVYREADEGNESVAVVETDLANFKVVNDELGHEVGDRLLRAEAEALVEATRFDIEGRPGDTIGHTVNRVGGDEFPLKLRNIDDPAKADIVMQRANEIFARKVEAIIGDRLPKQAYPFIAWGTEIRAPRDARDAKALTHAAEQKVIPTKNRLKAERGVPESREELTRYLAEHRAKRGSSSPVAPQSTPAQAAAGSQARSEPSPQAVDRSASETTAGAVGTRAASDDDTSGLAAYARIGRGHARLVKNMRELTRTGTITPEGANVILEAFRDADTEHLYARAAVRTASREQLAALGKRFGQSGTPSGVSLNRIGQAARLQVAAFVQRGLVNTRARQGSTRADMEPVVATLHELGHSFYTTMATAEDRAIVRRSFESMSPKQRAAFLAEGLSESRRDRIAKYFAANPDEWLAQSFAEYVISNRVPDTAIRPLLQRLGDVFKRALERLKGRRRLSPEMESLLERLRSGRAYSPSAALGAETTSGASDPATARPGAASVGSGAEGLSQQPASSRGGGEALGNTTQRERVGAAGAETQRPRDDADDQQQGSSRSGTRTSDSLASANESRPGARGEPSRTVLASSRVVAGSSPNRTREPWEMTRDEYLGIGQSGRSPYEIEIGANDDRRWRSQDRAQAEGFHKWVHIQPALDAGRPVPANVLADYPELANPSEIPNSSTVPTQEPSNEEAGPTEAIRGNDQQAQRPVPPGRESRPVQPGGRETRVQAREEEVAERPPLAGATGRTATLELADGQSLPVTYRLVEAESLLPSHDARKGFAVNRGADPNERRYEDPTEGKASRDTVKSIAASPKPSLLLTDTPSALDGPPVVGPTGIVLGGNARTMGLQLAYSRGGKPAETIKTATLEAAGRFGIDEAQYAGFKNPVIVRVLSEEDAGKPGELSRVLNQGLTTGKTRATESASRGAKIDERAAVEIAAAVGDGSLAEALSDGPKSARIIRALRTSGAFSDADLISMIGAGKQITPSGKSAIEDALVGAAIPDVRTLAETPPAVRQVVVRALPSIVRLNRPAKSGGDPGFKEDLSLALQGLAELRASDSRSIDDLLTQQVLTPQPWRTPRAIALMRLIDENKPTQVANRLGKYADAVQDAQSGQERLIGGVQDIDEAFEEHIGTADTGGETGGALFGPEENQTDSPAFRKWFRDSKVVGPDGKPLVVYHGAQRPDRIGTRFRSSRATSGPMAFFTSDPEIAGGYAKGKADTSLDRPDSYVKWFKFKPKGSRSEVDISRMWWSVSADERARIASVLPHVTNFTKDGDEMDGFRLGDDDEYGLANKDHWKYTIREHRGNVLEAAVDIWLDSGALFDRESEFLKVLETAQIKGVRLDDPDVAMSSIFPVYLAITNPFVVDNITTEQIETLQKAANRTRSKPKPGADLWDKRSRSSQVWMQELRDDVKNNTTYAWTSIPDWVTDQLRRWGHDGIKDTGGKMGGPKHVVWIPFDDSQVKSATGNRGTFDSGSPNILFAPSEESDLRRITTDELGFFSRVQRFIADKIKGPQPSDAILKAMKSGQLSHDELKWTGLDDWLTQKGANKVTPAELQKFVAENRVTLNEIVKSDGSGDNELADATRRYDQAAEKLLRIVRKIDQRDTAMSHVIDQVTFYNAGGPSALSVEMAYQNAVQAYGTDKQDELRSLGAFEAFKEAREAHRAQTRARDARRMVNTTAYRDFALPGGENYREVLLTLPEKPGLPDGYEARQMKDGRWGVFGPGPLPENRYGSGNTREDAIRAFVGHGHTGAFKSSHFSEPNIIAHMRTTDRESLTYTPQQIDDIERRIVPAVGARSASSLANGSADFAVRKGAITALEAAQFNHAKGMNADTTGAVRRVLFAEEIQSDWHQTGRDKGYREPPIYELPEGFKAHQFSPGEKATPGLPAFPGTWTILDASGQEVESSDPIRASSKQDAIDNYIAHHNAESTRGKPPPAPFSKTWHEMAFRRLLRIAAEGGYDAVGWTTGKQQADRYEGLATQIERVRWSKQKDGDVIVIVHRAGSGRNYEMVAGENGTIRAADLDINSTVADRTLEEVFGVELARRIKGEVSGDIRGTDITIGGEGMRTFYDSVLPRYASKFGNKFGAKAEMGIIRTGPEGNTDINQGQVPYRAEEKASVHILPITPEMRTKIKAEGLPLFGPSVDDPGDPGKFIPTPAANARVDRPGPSGVIPDSIQAAGPSSGIPPLVTAPEIVLELAAFDATRAETVGGPGFIGRGAARLFGRADTYIKSVAQEIRRGGVTPADKDGATERNRQAANEAAAKSVYHRLRGDDEEAKRYEKLADRLRALVPGDSTQRGQDAQELRTFASKLGQGFSRLAQQYENADAAKIKKIMDRLSRDERRQVGRVGLGFVKPSDVSERVRKAADAVQTIMDKGQAGLNAAADVGLKRRSPKGRYYRLRGSGLWMPMSLNAKGRAVLADFAKAGRESPKIQAMIDKMAAQRPDESREDIAEDLFDFIDSLSRGVNRYFERTRTMLPEEYIETDPTSILPGVIKKNARTVAAGRTFGGYDDTNSLPEVDQAIVIMRQYDPDAAARFSKYIGMELGKAPTSGNVRERAIARNVTTLQNVTKLSTLFGPIRNSAQPWINTADYGILPRLKAYFIDYPYMIGGMTSRAGLVGARARAAAERAGSTTGTIGPDADDTLRSRAGRTAQDVLMYPFRASQHASEVRADAIARNAAEQAIRDLASLEKPGFGIRKLLTKAANGFGTERSRQTIMRRMARLGLTPGRLSEIVASGRRLTEEELDLAGWHMAHDTQFAMTTASKPLFYENHPAAKILTQYKMFGMRQSGLIVERIVKEGARGNFVPAMQFGLAALVAGELLALLRDWIKGEDQSVIASLRTKADSGKASEAANRAIAHLTRGGLAGALGDTEFGIANYIAGPTVSTATDIAGAAVDIARRPTALQATTAARRLIERQAPGIGQVRAIGDVLTDNKKAAAIAKLRARGAWHKTPAERWEQRIFGPERYRSSGRTLMYHYAARAISSGDTDAAREYMTDLLRGLQGQELAAAIKGLRASAQSRSPLGGMSKDERADMLSAMSTTARREAEKLDAEWTRDYLGALREAATAARKGPK